MSFKLGEVVIVNENAVKGLPNRTGERAVVVNPLYSSNNYEYFIEFDDRVVSPVKESEINKLTEKDKENMEYIFTMNNVTFVPSNEKVTILKVDYILEKVEILFDDGSTLVTDFNRLENDGDVIKVIEQVTSGKFTEIGLSIGEFTDKKNKQYGSSVDATYDMIKVLMERYKNENNTYTIPESLLQHILLQVRMMDKINRIFNNPSGKGDSESPYNDLAGYSLIGIDMVSK